MVTLASVTPDPGDVFTRHLSRVARRSLGD
jgi:hypothetical protein